MAREIAGGDVLCEALLVSAYHRININFNLFLSGYTKRLARFNTCVQVF